MAILYTEKDLHKRENKIRKLLRPLLGDRQDITARRVSTTGNSMIFSVFSGSSPVTNSHRDMTFKTLSKSIRGNYFEVWKKTEKKEWQLSNAYLKLIDLDQKELLSLHCDPSESKDSEIYIYKSGPHLHISHPTNSIISSAHVALNISDLEEVLSSIDNLEKAFGNALNMISNEVILKTS